jgi:hypothetical protein
MILSLITTNCFFALASQPQTTSQEKQIAKWKEDLKKRGTGEESRWEAELLDGRIVKGYASEIREDGITLVDWKTKETFDIAFSEIQSLKKKSSLSTGAKIALFAALGVGALLAIGALLLATSEGD